MFLLRPPTRAQIDALLLAQRQSPFTYAEVGASRSAAPPGYRVDHNRIELGAGLAAFERAAAALRRWEMFHFGWVQLCWPDVPIAAGATVAVLASVFGVWSVNVCRVVYVIDEDDRQRRRFGFGYGTLPAHEARGEERFLIEWDRASDAVAYDILAFSRPRSWLAHLGYPAMRIVQRRFAAASKLAMLRSVARIASEQKGDQ